MEETDTPLVEAFVLDVTLRHKHVRRSQLIVQLEGMRTVQSSPVALAIRDKLQETGITFSEVASVHDPNFLGSYTKLFDVLIGDQSYTCCAEHPPELIEGYEGKTFTDKLTFQLEFQCYA